MRTVGAWHRYGRPASDADQDDAGQRQDDPGLLQRRHALVQDGRRQEHRHDRVERGEHRGQADEAVAETRRRARCRACRRPDRERDPEVRAAATSGRRAPRRRRRDEQQRGRRGRSATPTRSRPCPRRASTGSRCRSRARRAAPARRRRRRGGSLRGARPRRARRRRARTRSPRAAGRRVVAGRDPEDDRHDRGRRRAIGATTLIAPSACRGSTRTARACRRRRPAIANSTCPARRALAADRDGDRDRRRPADLRPEQHPERAQRPADERADEICDAPREARAEREQQRRQSTSAGGGDRVELVRVVEHRRLGRSRRARVVVRRRRSAGAPRLRRGRALRRAPRSAVAPRWTCPSRRPSSVARTPARGRARACGRRRAGAPRRAAGRRADADGAARSRGRASRRRPCARADRLRSEWWSSGVAGPRREVAVGEYGCDGRREPGMRELRDEEIEEPGELVGVAPDVGVSDAGSTSLASSERTSSCSRSRNSRRARAPHRVALVEASVEQLDVVPHARLDAAGRVDQLEREVRRAGLRAELALRPHRVDPSTTRSSASSAIVTGAVYGRAQMRNPSPSRPSAISSSTAAASSRRQPSAPPGRRRSARPPGRARARRAPTARISREGRQLTRQRSTCGANSRARALPTGPSCSTRCEFVSTSCRCSEATARSTSFFAAPVTSRSSGPVDGPLASIIATILRLPAPPARRRRSPPRGSAARRGAMQAATRARCLPTHASPAAGRSSFAPQRKLIGSLQRTKAPSGIADRPVLLGAAVDLFPQRRQHEIGLGKTTARPARSIHAAASSTELRTTCTRLGWRECRLSGRSARSTTTRPVAGRWTRSSRRRTTSSPTRQRARLPRAQPVQRRPPDAPRLRAGRPPRSRVPGARRACSPRTRAGCLVGGAGLRRPRRRRAHARGLRRLGRPSRRTRRGRCCRTSARTRARRRGAASAARHADAARADLPALRRRPGARSAGRRARTSTSTRAASARVPGT